DVQHGLLLLILEDLVFLLVDLLLQARDGLPALVQGGQEDGLEEEAAAAEHDDGEEADRQNAFAGIHGWPPISPNIMSAPRLWLRPRRGGAATLSWRVYFSVGTFSSRTGTLHSKRNPWIRSTPLFGLESLVPVP